MKRLHYFSYLIFNINYYLFKIFGLAPFKIELNNYQDSNSINNLFEFSYCKLSSFYNIILVVLVMSMNYTSILFLYNYHTFNDISPIAAKVFFIKAIIGVSVLIASWIIIWVKKHNAINCGNKFIKINIAMIKARHLFSHNPITFRIAAILIMNIFIWIFLVITDYLLFQLMLSNTAISLLLPSFICSLFFIQYGFILILIKIRINNLNCAIMKLTPRKIMFDYKNSVSVLSQSSSPSQLILDNLITIRKNYDLLCEVLREITSIYSLPIFFMIISFNYNIISSMYYYMKLFIKPTSEWSVLTIINSFCYMAMEIFPLIIMTTSVTEISNEMDSTADTIYSLMKEPIRDREIRIQLEAFSLELLYKKVNFNACNMFPLDRRLLHSIVSMVTTYLIILLQYSPPKNKSTSTI